MKYIHHDERGMILGIYDDAIHEDIPHQSIKVTREKLDIFLSDQPYYKVDLTRREIVRIDSQEILLLEKRSGIAKIKEFAAATRAMIAGDADYYQTASWADKRARAIRIKQGIAELEDVEIVQHEVDKRAKGETVDQLIERQLQKAKKLALATYEIDGLQKAAMDKVNSVSDVSEIPKLLVELKEAAEQEISIIITS